MKIYKDRLKKIIEEELFYREFYKDGISLEPLKENESQALAELPQHTPEVDNQFKSIIGVIKEPQEMEALIARLTSHYAQMK